VVFTTPAVHALRRKFPQAHITYIVEPAAAPIVLNSPHLNEVIVAPRGHGVRGLLDDLSLGRRLHAERFDVAIDFQGLQPIGHEKMRIVVYTAEPGSATAQRLRQLQA